MNEQLLDSILADAEELASGDATGPHVVKFALWIAACTASQPLGRTARIARRLRKFVIPGLPENKADIYREIQKAGGLAWRNHVNAIYRAEELEREGVLEEELETWWTHRNHERQFIWREHMRNHMKGYGMSWKTISFTMLLMKPLHCKLVPVDRHVLARMNEVFPFRRWRYPRTYRRYEGIESAVQTEQDEEPHPRLRQLPLGLYHWYKWEEWRQLHNVSTASGGCETHRDLNPRLFHLEANTPN